MSNRKTRRWPYHGNNIFYRPSIFSFYQQGLKDALNGKPKASNHQVYSAGWERVISDSLKNKKGAMPFDLDNAAKIGIPDSFFE